MFAEPEELDFIMCGQPHISLQEWKSNTVYREQNSNPNDEADLEKKKFFYEHHHIAQWFWESLATLTQEELRLFLQFSTSS